MAAQSIRPATRSSRVYPVMERNLSFAAVIFSAVFHWITPISPAS